MNRKLNICFLLVISIFLLFLYELSAGEIVFVQGDPHYINHFPDPVNLRTGNLYLPSVDVDIDASNVNLKLERSYNSLLSGTKGPMGYGWRHNYMVNVAEAGAGQITISEADGFITKFNMTEELKKDLADRVCAARKSFDESKGKKKTDEFYDKLKEKMMLKSSYLFEMTRDYMPKLKSSPNGTYYSLSRKGQILVKSEDGYMRRYYDGKKDYFDKNGLIVKIEDRNNNYIGLKYRSGSLVKVFDRNDLSLDISYSSEGYISEVKDPQNNLFKYIYDRAGNLSKTVGFAQEQESFSYNSLHKLTSVTLANGSSVEIRYDNQSRVSAQLGPGPKKAIYAYDKEGGVLTGSVTDAKGNKRSFKFNNKAGEIVEINPDGKSKTSVYHPLTGKLTKTIDEKGRITNFAYNNSGDLTKILNPLGYSTTFSYGPFGNMISYALGGSVTNYAYDKRGNLISKVMPTGEKFSYRYDSYGNITKIINPDSTSISMRYDKYGNIRQLIDPFNNITRFEADVLGRITRQTDPLGGTSQISHDRAGNTTSLSDELGQAIKVEYSKDGKPIEIVDARGARTTYSYNDMGLVEKETNALGLIKSYQYDPAGNPIKIINFDGTSFIYEYNASNKMTRMSWPGGFNIYSYDALGNLTSIKDNAGNVHSYLYDDIGRLTKIFYPDKTSEAFSYGFDSVTETDRFGNKSISRYDKLGRIIQHTDPRGVKTSFSYDYRSKVTEVKSEGGGHYQYVYDALGRLIETKLEGSTISKADYDKRGNLVELLDRSGIKSRFKYDAAGHLIESENSLTGNMKFTYNAQGDLASREGPLGGKEIYRYNKQGQLVSRQLPDGIIESYTYDKFGRVRTRKSEAGSLTFNYDEAGNILKVSDGNKSMAEFKYDSSGRIVSARNQSAHYTYTYDNNNKLVAQKDVKRGKQLNLKYNRLGLVSTILDGTKRIRSFKYDKFGQLSLVSDELDRTYGFLHDKYGRVKQLTYPNGVRTRFTYDQSGRVITLNSKSAAGKSIYSAKYQYDDSGNILREVSNNGNKNYLYDGTGRLTQANYSSASFKYEYDKTGNRIEEISFGETKKYTYSNSGQLLKAGKASLSYDKNGNLVQKTQETSKFDYRYSSSGQLSEVLKNGKSALQVSYDPFGRKYSETKGGKTTFFRYFGLHSIIEEDSRGNPIRSFVHSSDMLDLDFPLALIENGKALYPILDARGNTVRLVSNQGSVVGKFDYEPFGKPFKTKTKVETKLAFASRPYYGELGLSDFRYRFYDSDTGRFISKDMLSPASALNEYAYPGNNPGNRDPLGLVSFGSKSIAPRESGTTRTSSSAGPGYTGPATPGPGISTTPVTRDRTNTRVTNPVTPQPPPSPSFSSTKPNYLKMLFWGAALPWGINQLSSVMATISPRLDFSEVTGSFLDLYMGGGNPVAALMLGVTQKVLGVTDKVLPRGGNSGSQGPIDLADINMNQFQKDLAILSGEALLEKYPDIEVRWLDKNYLLVYFGEGKVGQFECDDLEKIRKSKPKSSVYYQNQSGDRTPPGPDRTGSQTGTPNYNDVYQMYQQNQQSQSSGNTRQTSSTSGTTTNTGTSGSGQRNLQNPRSR